jgi:predicted transcriptional regulator
MSILEVASVEKKRTKSDIIYLLVKSDSESEHQLQQLTGWPTNEIKVLLNDLIEKRRIKRIRQSKCTYKYKAVS